jgi:hypothetical protein
MEPFTAFSLAGTVLAFSRFGMALLGDARELYKSTQGALTANEELELVIIDLQALLIKLKARFPATDQATITRDREGLDNDPTRTLSQIIEDAEELAKELLKRLNSLKVKSDQGRKWGRKWESVRKAVESVWTKDEIAALNKRLESFKNAVKTSILVSIM